MLTKQKFDQKVWLIRLIKNWREVLTSMNEKTSPKPPLVLKNGLIINIPQEDREYQAIILSLMKDMFVNKMFVQDDFYQPESDDVIVDIGSHIGVFPIFCHSQTQDYFTMHCFEPFSANFELSKKNIQQNQLEDSVNIYPYGVLDKAGQQNLWTHVDTHSYYNPSIFRDFVTEEGEEAIYLGKIPCVSLEECLNMIDTKSIDFLKIHCEGSELPMLESTPLEVFKRIKKIAVACHNLLHPQCTQRVNDILVQNNFTTKVHIYTTRPEEGGIIQAKNLNFNA